MKNLKYRIKNLKSKMVLIIIVFAILRSYSYSNFGQWEVFTNKNDVRDIALSSDGSTLWAATKGGVVEWNLGDNSYKSYTTLDGLISCNITQVAVDKEERPWVATKNPAGLFVYEKHSWKRVKVGGPDYEIGDQNIFSLEIDRFGNVWVSIERDYLLRYDGKKWFKYDDVCGPLALDLKKNLLAIDTIHTDCNPRCRKRFRMVSFNSLEFVSKWRSYSKIYHNYTEMVHIAFDIRGDAWFACIEEKDSETYGVFRNDTVYTTLDGLADDNVRSITPDESGIVWCATDGGISKFTGSGWVTYDTTDGVASNLVYRILIGSDNTLYAATSKGISVLKSNRFNTLKTINEPPGNTYKDIVIDKRGAVVLASGDYITVYNGLQWKIVNFQDISLGQSYYRSFPDHWNNNSLIKSKDGTIYAIGNEIKGKDIKNGCILKQGEDGSTFSQISSFSFYKHERFRSPAVAGSGNDPIIWLTYDKRCIASINKQTTNIFDPWRLDIYGSITCMLLDRDEKSVWVGYGSDGIIHFDGDTVKERISDDLARDQITALARDSSENIWFTSSASRSGEHRGWVAVLRDTIRTTYLWDSNNKVFAGCNALFVDKSGMVWVHADYGIARYDGSLWKLFDSSAVSPDLPYSSYSHIIQDKSGTVWFGTEGYYGSKGSGLLAYKDNKWYQYTTRDGIPHNNIRGLAVDKKNNLWILTKHGIAMRKSDGKVHNRAQHDFADMENKHIIKQIGNQFYVSSKEKPKMIRYTLFDLRGRVVHTKTVNDSKFFVIPENYLSIGSGLRILSITTVFKDTNGKQNRKVMILDF